jgi:hypothetical protein
MQRLSQISRFQSAITPVSQRAFGAAQPKFGPKLDAHGEPRFLEQVKLFYANAAPKTGISDEKLNHIKACEALVRFNIPLRMDDGSL